MTSSPCSPAQPVRPSAKTPPSVPQPAETKTLGYYLFTEKTTNLSLVWSDDRLLRVSGAPLLDETSLLKPLSPVYVTTPDGPGAPFGKYKTPTSTAKYINLAMDPPEPQFLKGFFQKVPQAPEKIAFFANPGGLLRSPVKAVLFSSDFPDVPFNEELFVSLAIRKPGKSGYSFPFIQEVRRKLDGPQTYTEPPSQILPPPLLQDLYENPALDIFLGIGVPENPHFPVLSFEEFCRLSARGTPRWPDILAAVAASYTRRAEEKDHPYYSVHLSMILKHANNPKKSVLLFPGRWSLLTTSSADEIAHTIIGSSPLNAFVLRTCHPLSNKDNVRELNPHLTGIASAKYWSERHFIPVPVGLGEVSIDGAISFTFSHAVVPLMLLKYHRPPVPQSTSRSMFQPVHLVNLQHYTGPPELKETDSDTCANSLFIAFPKGAAPAAPALTALARSGIYSKSVRDPERVRNYYSIFEFYSPFKSVSFDAISSLLAVEEKKGGPEPSLLGKGCASQPSIETPCSPDNGLRIIHLGQVGLIGPLQFRSAPITILQRLGLAQEITPLSNFYYKFKLSPNVSDAHFQARLHQLNRGLSDPLFSSVYDGDSVCKLFTPKNAGPAQLTFLILDEPPPPCVSRHYSRRRAASTTSPLAKLGYWSRRDLCDLVPPPGVLPARFPGDLRPYVQVGALSFPPARVLFFHRRR